MFIFSLLQVIQDAFTEMFEKYHLMMKNLAYSILKDYQLAEDAVQESLLSLSKNMDKIDNIHSDRSKNYIYTITKNKSLSMLKKQKSENSVQFYDTEELNHIEGELDINAFCDDFGFSEKVAEALSGLDAVDRDIIVYRFGAGYSGKEIAKMLGKEPDYVYKRLQRAMKKLQKVL